MSFQFLHAADIHLDSPLLNLQRYDGAPLDAFRSATRRAFDNLVELAIEQQVKFVIVAGDLYDGDCKDFSTPLHIRSKLAELGQANIRVVICQGNHDAQSHMRKAFRLQLPDNVHLFRTDRPETIRWDDLEIAIHGQGFAKREVQEDLSEAYPSPVPGMINIGVLHTSCGPYETHQRYAPSSISGLTSKGYDYWALGHIHKRERLAGPQPFIVYPGNIQGRHIREDGPKGCELVRIQNGTITGTKFVPLDVIRWCRGQVDVETCHSVDEIHEPVEATIRQLLGEHSPLPLAIRLELVGRSAVHRSLQRQADHWDRQLRTMAVDLFGEQVWLEKFSSTRSRHIRHWTILTNRLRWDSCWPVSIHMTIWKRFGRKSKTTFTRCSSTCLRTPG
ncbi:MAG: DNA repair exonuclease [Pirellulaceae bacterium]